MNALVVYETLFGNTHAIAAATLEVIDEHGDEGGLAARGVRGVGAHEVNEERRKAFAVHVIGGHAATGPGGACRSRPTHRRRPVSMGGVVDRRRSSRSSRAASPPNAATCTCAPSGPTTIELPMQVQPAQAPASIRPTLLTAAIVRPKSRATGA